ncbi:uncharacterized protein LOC143274946 [Babylonia areolata]|uniref:uncharacterized protein LOC143274946 n=1 Tax=Babylonia areolata TaxID=304850 RepID=UPI003FD31274
MRVGPFFVLSLLLASISAVVSDQSEDRDVRFPEYGCKAGGDLCEIDDDCCSLYCKWDDATEHSVCDVNPLLRTWMKKTQQIGYQDFEYGCKTDGMLCEEDDECCSLYQCMWDYITYRNECGYP